MAMVTNRIKRFTPDGMYSMLEKSAAEPNAASMHELFYLGHQERCMSEPLNPLVKWMAEKCLERDVLGKKQIEQGNFNSVLIVTGRSNISIKSSNIVAKIIMNL